MNTSMLERSSSLYYLLHKLWIMAIWTLQLLWSRITIKNAQTFNSLSNQVSKKQVVCWKHNTNILLEKKTDQFCSHRRTSSDWYLISFDGKLVVVSLPVSKYVFWLVSRFVTYVFYSLCPGCPKKNDTVTLSYNFRLNYSNSKFEAGCNFN